MSRKFLTITTLLALIITLAASASSAVQLSFNITQPINAWGEARVFWSTPTTDDISNDWVSLWLENLNATYVRYDNVTAHTGSSLFPILNTRRRLIFRYYRGDDMVQETAWFAPTPHVPMQVRLTTTDDQNPTKMRISWTSDRVSPKAAVFLGTDPKQLSRVIYAMNQKNYTNKKFPPVDTYTKQFMNDYLQLPPTPTDAVAWPNIGCRCLRCGGHCYDDDTILRLWYDPGFFYNVEVDQLNPGQVYYYQVGEVGGEITPEIRSFRAMIPPAGDATIHVLYVADGGIAAGPLTHTAGSITDNDPPANGGAFVWDLLNKKLAANPGPAPLFNFAIFNGDLTYARGDGHAWEVFHNQTSNGLFDRIPLMPTFGNHERDFNANTFDYARGGDSGGEAGVVAGKRYLVDYEAGWYRRTSGPALFIFLNTEVSAEPQMKWLRQTVAPEIDRNVTKWIVATLHRPLYSLMAPDTDTYTAYLEQYSDIFDAIGVDIVLQGHQHQYTRFCSVSSEVCNTWGFRPVYESFVNQEMTNAALQTCTLSTNWNYFTANQCKVGCNQNEQCTGVQWNQNQGVCTLLNCTVGGGNTQYSWSGQTLYSLTRVNGSTSPVYIVDGTAGAEFSTPEVKHDARVRYTDVKRWGYSTLTINATTLHWQHFHLNERLADDLILKK